MIFDILGYLSRSSAKNTTIKYRIRISPETAQDYLEYLMKKKLVAYDGTSKYFITNKGREYLLCYQKIRDLLEENC
ncbi:MAG: hypothetical protein KGI33_10500 [Thaumarchaeota archaeon]|nr:hypothetical protein [Nitrososphaerota archaeon]